MPTLLVAGTASHVGKSTVVTGLCRLLSDAGVDVAPFKAQNMSTNARAVPRAVGSGLGADTDLDFDSDTDTAFGEIGISQYTQARAARVAPTTDHNPVLLKPQGDGESQLLLDGRVVADVAAGAYYDTHWERARDTAAAAHARLAAEHDVVVAEGAGSIAEINLHHRDLSNVETPRFARERDDSVAILLVADIERGGVFAAILGTLELVPDDIRSLVCGVVITKFRGDASLLESGIDAIETRTGVPVLGVLPYDDPGLPEEDSVAVPESGAVRGAEADDAEASVTVVVPRLPHIANYTDLGPVEAEPGVRVAYRALDAPFADADAVVVPGTKNSVDDLLALHDAGYGERLAEFSGPIVGLCGGYQLLGERLTNAAVEGTGDDAVVPGLGLLPVETAFSPDKRVVATTLSLDASTGPLAGARGAVSGYEIHQGRTHATGPVERPFAPVDGDPTAALGAARGRVVGTYLHGLFENEFVREQFITSLFEAKGETRPLSDEKRETPYDRAAALVERMDVDSLLAAVDVDRSVSSRAHE